MAEGIAVALLGYAEDEGAMSAARKAERWRDVLEEMAEVADAEQRRALARLLEPVRAAIGAFAGPVNEALEAVFLAPARRRKRGRG